MFLRMARSFLLFLIRNKNTAINNCKQDLEVASTAQTGSINSMFLRMARSFLLFLIRNKDTAINNCKQDFEVASTEYMLRLM